MSKLKRDCGRWRREDEFRAYWAELDSAVSHASWAALTKDPLWIEDIIKCPCRDRKTTLPYSASIFLCAISDYWTGNRMCVHLPFQQKSFPILKLTPPICLATVSCDSKNSFSVFGSIFVDSEDECFKNTSWRLFSRVPFEHLKSSSAGAGGGWGVTLVRLESVNHFTTTQPSMFEFEFQFNHGS